MLFGIQFKFIVACWLVVYLITLRFSVTVETTCVSFFSSYSPVVTHRHILQTELTVLLG